MANDSLADERRAHQLSAQNELKGREDDSFALSRVNTLFNLPLTHQDRLPINRLLMTGKLLSEKGSTTELTQWWKTILAQFEVAKNCAGVTKESRDEKSTKR